MGAEPLVLAIPQEKACVAYKRSLEKIQRDKKIVTLRGFGKRGMFN